VIDSREGVGTLIRLRLPVLPDSEELTTATTSVPTAIAPTTIVPAPADKSFRTAE
jgi:hypothetical protein